jgi:hypothetical protein
LVEHATENRGVASSILALATCEVSGSWRIRRCAADAAAHEAGKLRETRTAELHAGAQEGMGRLKEKLHVS